jgi:hypothetical protein
MAVNYGLQYCVLQRCCGPIAECVCEAINRVMIIASCTAALLMKQKRSNHSDPLMGLHVTNAMKLEPTQQPPLHQYSEEIDQLGTRVSSRWCSILKSVLTSYSDRYTPSRPETRPMVPIPKFT